jgi:hypothetical protein
MDERILIIIGLFILFLFFAFGSGSGDEQLTNQMAPIETSIASENPSSEEYRFPEGSKVFAVPNESLRR